MKRTRAAICDAGTPAGPSPRARESRLIKLKGQLDRAAAEMRIAPIASKSA